MLRRLKIENLALVDDACVEPGPGMNAITGETGAGKSLLIGALRLLLGERADKSMIRTGETRCAVRAEFEPPDPSAVNAILEETGLPPCEEGRLSLRRILSASGSRAWINDESATAQTLRRIGDVLVDLHGPYDHQSLLDPTAQRRILDAFAGAHGPAKAYRKTYEHYREASRRLRELESADDETVDRRIEFLEYRIEEIERADLSPEEEKEVLEEHERAANARELIELSGAVVSALTEAEGCAFDALTSARQNMERLVKLAPETDAWREEIDHAVVSVRETAGAIEALATNVDASPERMAWLEERLATYQTLKRKYGSTPEEITKNAEDWRREVAELRGRDAARAAARQSVDLARETMERAAEALRAERKKAGVRLAEAIETELREIGFETAAFETNVEPCEPGPEGMDAIEFVFAPNAGEAARPLRAIASSGEISRVMLAVKTVLARVDRIPVLIFDEIDANVGGEIGAAIGRKLARVAQSRQVICITHLPQVAVFATTHLAVRKETTDGRTRTLVRRLAEDERPAEIARMLGGTESAATALDHALGMLDQARKKPRA